MLTRYLYSTKTCNWFIHKITLSYVVTWYNIYVYGVIDVSSHCNLNTIKIMGVNDRWNCVEINGRFSHIRTHICTWLEKFLSSSGAHKWHSSTTIIIIVPLPLERRSIISARQMNFLMNGGRWAIGGGWVGDRGWVGEGGWFGHLSHSGPFVTDRLIFGTQTPPKTMKPDWGGRMGVERGWLDGC